MNEPSKILVVDDDQVILDSVADIIRLAGYETIKAINGRDGLEKMQTETPNLIVADVMMPEMTGIEFFHEVRQNPAWQAIPFIFLTARGTKEDVRHGLSLGADYYLTKPFEPEDLLVAIQSRIQRIGDLRAASQHEVDRTKQQLITVFSHEFRTPLSTLYGSIGLLQEGRDLMDGDSLGHILDMMRGSADRLVRLVEDLMMMVNIQSGMMATELAKYSQPTDLSYEISRAARELSVEAARRGVDFTTRAPKELVVLGIPAYLNDIFRRLMDNAIKFSKRNGGNVWIEAGADAEQGVAVIKIKDDGIGIAENQMGELFQPLTQIDREVREQQGLGIGLALAQQIAELHRGKITVESQPEIGSEFTVTLPLHRVG